MKKHGKAITMVAVGLVAGLILGSIGIASAAPVTDPATGEQVGYGARMGIAIHEAGARLADIVADLTGLSVEDVEARRADGETVADIAESEGVDPAAVTDGALAARKAILDEKVADGTIDQETADLMLERMTDRISERIDSTETGGYGRGQGCGMGGGQGGRGMGGQGAGLQDGSCVVTE